MKKKSKLEDGTIEDQLNVALITISKLNIRLEKLESTIGRMGTILNQVSSSQASLADVMVTVLEVPGEVLDASYENTAMYKQAHQERGSIVGQVKSRQDSLRKRLENMEG